MEPKKPLNEGLLPQCKFVEDAALTKRCFEESSAEDINNANAENANAVPRDFTKYTPKE